MRFTPSRESARAQELSAQRPIDASVEVDRQCPVQARSVGRPIPAPHRATRLLAMRVNLKYALPFWQIALASALFGCSSTQSSGFHCLLTDVSYKLQASARYDEGRFI